MLLWTGHYACAKIMTVESQMSTRSAQSSIINLWLDIDGFCTRKVQEYASKSAHPAVMWWLIDWLDKHCLYFFPFFLNNHLRLGLYFCFIQRMILMPIDKLELAEFGRFFTGKYRFLKCADFEAYPRTQSINQPSNNMGVRRLRGISSYSINQSTIE